MTYTIPIRTSALLLGLGLIGISMPSSSLDSTTSLNIELQTLAHVGEVSLRGVAQKGDRHVWVSGSSGTVQRSVDAGVTWSDVAPPGTEELDFRDIAILDSQTVLLMSVGSGSESRIFKTADGGQTWRLTLSNEDEGAFFNGFDFWSPSEGVLTSDSADGRLLLLRTLDAGETWKRIGQDSLPKLTPGEAGFAASGTGVVTLGDQAWVATGGSAARVFRSTDRGSTWSVFDTPMTSGSASAGIFSISFRDSANGVIVGGDYLHPEVDEGNVAWTSDGGQSWTRASTGEPIEQKACVRFLSQNIVLAAGRSGLILSRNSGRSWHRVDGPPFYAFDFDEASGIGFLAGSEGRIGKLEIRLLSR